MTKQNAIQSVPDGWAADLVFGVRGISVEIGMTERQVVHLLQLKKLPVAKIGGKVFASRSKLREHFQSLLAG